MSTHLNPQPGSSRQLPIDPPPRRYPSSPSSTASSESDDDTPGPDPPRRGDDRNLRINSNLLYHPNAPALATPSNKIGSHPWPFNTLSPRLNNPTQSIEPSHPHPNHPPSSSSTASSKSSSQQPHHLNHHYLHHHHHHHHPNIHHHHHHHHLNHSNLSTDQDLSSNIHQPHLHTNTNNSNSNSITPIASTITTTTATPASTTTTNATIVPSTHITPSHANSLHSSRSPTLTTWIRRTSQNNLSRPLSLSSSLPHEILIQILRSVSSTSDLRRALLVCKAWCQCGIELLWHKPTFPSTSCLIKMLVSLASKNQTFPYISFIRRLNFSGIADHMTDHILLRLVNCTRLERLTLSGCNSITDDSIIKILRNSQDLVALDLSDCKLVTDECIHAVGQYSKSLQGLNLSGCKAMTDLGLQSLRHCKALRRLKLKYCEKITDAAIIAVAVACPLLLEVDLVGCKLITNASLWMLWKHSSHLRELSLSGCTEISDGGFPSSANCHIGADGLSHPILEEVFDDNPSNHRVDVCSTQESSHHSNPDEQANSTVSHQFDNSGYDFIASLTHSRRLDESVMHFDHIRFLDLTSLAKLTDASLDGIIKHMPRIRNLVLAKCVGLTDEALNSICGLGKYLHYLHLGHVSSLTDRAVIRIARSCTRLRYIDLACCNNLTDMSVFELAQCLPRLKRIGLVRVTNITDQSVYTLVERTSLERIHLSYCDNITVGAIHWLLQRLHRLTHLSLTGVPAFRRTDLQAWCRAPPKDFNAHQRQAFCVYSGKGVNELRYYLAALYLSITSNHNRTRGGPPSSSTNSSLEEDHTNNMTLSAAPIGPNLSVFNSMPDPRTMAAAMAAARQQTNPQLYGLSNRRRELRLPERSGRLAISDFLHQGPSSGVNSAVISGNGQLLGLPDLPRHGPRSFYLQTNGGVLPPSSNASTLNGLSTVIDRSETPNDHPSMMQLDDTDSDGAPVAGSSHHRPMTSSHHGLQPPNGSMAESESETENDRLRSPIPLCGNSTRRPPTVVDMDQGMTEGHQQVNEASRSSRVVTAGSSSATSPDDIQHNHSNGIARRDSALRIPHHHHHVITRRRSDVDMSNNGSTGPSHRRLLDSDGSDGPVDGYVAGNINSSTTNIGSSSSSSRLILMGNRTRSNGLNLEVPDRTDSVSPIEISDDERPPP